MNLRKLLGQQGFKTVKCNSFQSSPSLSVCTFLLYLPCSLYFQGCALHCSRAWWPLVPNFCSWASRKSYKSYAGHLGFYRFRALGPGQETWAVRTSGTGNYSVRTRKNVIPVVRMDDWVVEVQLKKSQETILTCFLWIYNKIFFP